MVHQDLIGHLRVQVTDVYLIVSPCIGSDCTHDVSQLRVMLGLRRVVSRCVPLLICLAVVLRVRAVLWNRLLHLRALACRRVSRFTGPV